MRSLSILLLLLTVVTATARPAYPGVLYATLTDGTRVAYRLVGDEHSHVAVTLDGRYIEQVVAPHPDAPAWATSVEATDATIWRYVEAPVRPDTPRPDAGAYAPSPKGVASSAYTDFPTIGEVRGLVLLAEFTDRKFDPEHTPELLQRQLNEPGYRDQGATGSARDYFMDQSMGQFRPQFDVVGPVQLPNNMAYYGANLMGQDARPGQMVVDACDYAHNRLGVDFSQYDYDGDGNVDFVFVIYAGYGENYGASANTIWPHMGRLSTLWIDYRQDGKRVNLYACSCEMHGATGNQLDGVGALCHEFGHVLGLPDLYNAYNQNQVQLGQWDVMDTGSYNNESRTPPSYSAFERHQCGWLDFVDLTEPQDEVIVPELTQSNVAYRIPTAQENEFFTLENRQQVGWDSAQAGRGLMILHVSYDKYVWQSNTVNTGSLPHYDLVEADGTPGRTYETDLYPIEGNDLFTDYSTPNSLAWNGEPTGRSVTRIRQHDDGTISLRYMNDRLASPELLPVTCLTDTTFEARWTAVEDAVGYRIHLAEIVPDSLNPLLLAEDFSLVTEGTYPSSTGQDIAADIDAYLHQPGWTASDVYPCGGMVRVGSYDGPGQLTTPMLLCADGGLTVSLTCRAYTGKRVDYDVTLLDADEAEVQTLTLQADRNPQTPVLRFEACPAAFRLRVATHSERLFVDALRVGRAEVDSLTLWQTEQRLWDVETEALATGDAEVESLVITGLRPSMSYVYSVTALDAEPMCNSLPSAEQIVTLPAATGIQSVRAEVEDRWLYDLQGRPHRAEGVRRGIYFVGGRGTGVRILGF